MLHALDLKRSYWDKYRNIKIPNSDKWLLEKISNIFESNKRQYGYRKITQELQNSGNKINHKKVLRIMNLNGIRAEYIRKMMKIKGQSKKIISSRNDYPDLIQRKFSQIKEENVVWYTDITYHILKGKRFYQSTIIDGFTKQIVDYKISKRNDLKLVMDNINDAISKIKLKKDPSGIIIHSDHGIQYTSNTYKKRCEIDNLIISMGKAYTCADNVVIESFHSLLKKGTIHNNHYLSIWQYQTDVIDWNEWYINKKATNF